MQKFERIQHKACMRIGAQRVDLLLNLLRLHPLRNALCGLNNEQAHAGGEIAAIDGIDIPQLLRGNAAILIGGGEVGAQIDMHHLVTILNPLAEVFHIFPRCDRARFGKLLALPPSLVQRIRGNLPIRILLALQQNMERIHVNLIALYKRCAQIAGAICA